MIFSPAEYLVELERLGAVKARLGAKGDQPGQPSSVLALDRV